MDSGIVGRAFWKWVLLWASATCRIKASGALLTSEFKFTFFSVGLDGSCSTQRTLSSSSMIDRPRISEFTLTINVFVMLYFPLHSSLKAYLCVRFRIQSHV